MNRYRVRIIDEAEADLEDIYDYIEKADGIERADYVLQALEELCLSLETQPQRGHWPPELDAIGERGFREVHFKPYRIIYEVIRREVVIHIIADGRRSLTSLLERRLLR